MYLDETELSDYHKAASAHTVKPNTFRQPCCSVSLFQCVLGVSDVTPAGWPGEHYVNTM